MPLFYQHTINDSTRLALWHITEDEGYFLKKVAPQNDVSHPHKRLQHLAGRYLLQILHPDFPLHLIEIGESKKPLLSNGEFHFSISHCGDFAAVIVSENKPVGIDVESIRPKIEMVKNKFLSAEELKLADGDNSRLLTLFWSTKEALYKWHGKGKVDFKNNMIIDQLLVENQGGLIKARFVTDETIDLSIEFRFLGNLCLAWV